MQGFKLDLEALGFWIAIATAAGVQGLVFGVVVALTDWHVQVRRAQLLAAEHAAHSQSTMERCQVGTGAGAEGTATAGDEEALQEPLLPRDSNGTRSNCAV